MNLPAYPTYKPSSVEWLGDVPEHWETKRLKYVASINDDALPEDTAADFEFDYVDIGGVSAIDGITAITRMYFENAPSRARRRVRDGDTIVSTVRTYLRAIAPIRKPPAHLVVSTGFAVVRPRRVHPGYLSYALRESSFVESIVARSVGVSYPAVNASEVVGVSVPLPDEAEQKAIAAFLDRQTARLDRLVSKKRELIERLKEKRTALISRTVTRGLPPAAARAAGLPESPPLKPSGIAWLGDIPSHWTVRRLKFVSPHVTVGIVVEPSKYYVDEGIPALRSLNVKPHRLTERDLVFISPEANDLHSKSKIWSGDLVAVRSGQPGTTAVVDSRFNGANCIDLIIIRRPHAALSEYLGFFLNSDIAKTQFDLGTGGAIQQHFNISTAASLQIVLPPKSEQASIIQYLVSQSAAMNALIAKVEIAIARLQEYRTALITAAVTGKIDVRGEITA